AAGLYCGILLAEAGHTVTIFEANDRAGGRILTYRDPKNPSKYIGELGAMRFSLDTQPYLNTLIRQRYKLNITEFSNFDENAYTYINGIRATNKQAHDNPNMFQFNTSQSERGKTPDQLSSEAMAPIFQTYSEGGWSAVRNQWDSYSVESYFNKMNLSRAAIDYIAMTGNYETDLFVSVLEIIRGAINVGIDPKFSRIQGGNDLLVQSMVTECQTMESNRCSIVYSTPISQVRLLTSNQTQLTTKNGVSQVFDTVTVATTPHVIQLIDFEPRMDFVQKYLALRQVHFDCSTKILLSFNTSWWYTQENIKGGASVTDLLIGRIHYPSTNSNQTDGGTVLASYTLSTSSIIWQSLSEPDAIELALKQLIQLHNSSSNMRDYFQGGKVKNWCQDPYERGAMALFTPFQETEIFDKLQASISNIHFIGEYTSFIHGWVEGALSSAIRAALSITEKAQTTHA
ncbi:unnamed protein product, partial [Didymodactylos carnosus]